LDLAVKARMIEHAFLGRLRDEYDNDDDNDSDDIK